MNFDYEKSKRKHLYDHYDGIPLILFVTYEGQDYLMYAITWDYEIGTYEYMLTAISEEAIHYLQKKGVKSFLQQQLDSGELYHLTTGMRVDSEPDKVRLLTKEESKEAFPEEEFVLDYTTCSCDD